MSSKAKMIQEAREAEGERRDATRAEIAHLLPGRKFSLRYVGFQDLARSGAYALRVEGLPDMMSAEEHAAWKPVLDALAEIKRRFTWKGRPILTS